MRNITISILFFVTISGRAVALPIIDSANGLVSPDFLVDFGTVHPSATPDSLINCISGLCITDQFIGQGVYFDGNYKFALRAPPPVGGPPHPPSEVAGHLQAQSDLLQPGSILFSQNVTDAAFSWRTDDATTTFTALLDGVIVEIFSTFTNAAEPPDSGRFYGFSGIVFNEIRIDISAFSSPQNPNQGNGFIFDNLQYNVVPLPGAVPLFLAGVAALGLIGCKRKNAAT